MKRVFISLLSALLLAAGLCACGKKESKKAILELSGPPGLVSETAGVELGETLKLTLPGGRYMFRFAAPGYRDDYRLLVLTPGKTLRHKVELAPVAAAVVISSTPSGAQVIFNGKNMGMTPTVITGLPAGKYSAELSLRGYAKYTVDWSISGPRPVAVAANLNSNVGTLTVSSTPGRARLFIDGVEVGETPYKIEREEGKYILRLERAGCNPEERNVQIVRKKHTKVNIVLGQKPGGITVKSSPAGADVYINGEKRGVTPCTVEALEPGKYKLVLKKGGFDPMTTTVNIVPGATDKKSYELRCSTGSVMFNASPAGVEVFLDGASLGYALPMSPGATSTKDFKIDKLAPGAHEITLFHALGKPLRRKIKFNVEKNKCTTLKNLQLWVANCEITYVDGTRERGALYSNEKDHVLFGPDPGVRFRIERGRIRQIRMLEKK